MPRGGPGPNGKAAVPVRRQADGGNTTGKCLAQHIEAPDTPGIACGKFRQQGHCKHAERVGLAADFKFGNATKRETYTLAFLCRKSCGIPWDKKVERLLV